MTMAEVPSWETVLHTVERDVLRTEALLVVAAANANDPDEARVASAARLLMQQVSDHTLPPLTTMPVLPPSLLERVQALRTRISQLRDELEFAMRANREMVAEISHIRPATPGTPPRYIDTVA